MGSERGGEVGAKCNTRSTEGEKETSWHHKGHDSSIITRDFLYHQREVHNGYVALG
jgi:hypothetical protein